LTVLLKAAMRYSYSSKLNVFITSIITFLLKSA
jgi:hypothetical protein